MYNGKWVNMDMNMKMWINVKTVSKINMELLNCQQGMQKVKYQPWQTLYASVHCFKLANRSEQLWLKSFLFTLSSSGTKIQFNCQNAAFHISCTSSQLMDSRIKVIFLFPLCTCESKEELYQEDMWQSQVQRTGSLHEYSKYLNTLECVCVCAAARK